MAFHVGWSQGFMLGSLLTSFRHDLASILFGCLIGLCLLAAYALLGAGWLIIKTDGDMQLMAVGWARRRLWMTGLGVLAISVATPWVSHSIFMKWFSFPNVIWLLPIPAATLVPFGTIWRSLGRLPVRLAQGNECGFGVPLGVTLGIFLLAFYGLAYSIFPWLVIDKVTIGQAASAPAALMVIFFGVAVVLPVIIAYTVFAYRIF